jgi:hypothetical protein
MFYSVSKYDMSWPTTFPEFTNNAGKINARERDRETHQAWNMLSGGIMVQHQVSFASSMRSNFSTSSFGMGYVCSGAGYARLLVSSL